MSANSSSLRIGVYGRDDLEVSDSRGCALWAPGYAAAVTYAGGEPVTLDLPKSGHSWDDILRDLDGILFLGFEKVTARQSAEEERLCEWCRKRRFPFLGVDRGMHVLNNSQGGTIFTDLPKEMPQALQHRHPPEKGLRHAIMVEPKTRLADLYGEGEIVVNSEHRCAVNRVGRGFRATGKALDGITEAIEAEGADWFAMGVQWQPASASASGLDIQLFRGLIDAALARQEGRVAGLAAA